MLQLNFVSILGIAAVLLSLLVVVKVALQPAQDRMAKALLLFFLLCLAALMVNHLYRYRVTRLYVVFPHFSGWTLMLMYCLGPALHAYVRRVALGARPWDQRGWFLHWLLPIAVELYLLRTFGRSTQEQFASFRSEPAATLRLFLYLTNYVQILFYVVLCRRPLQALQRGSATALPWVTGICRGLAVIVPLACLAALSGRFYTPVYSLFLLTAAGFLLMVTYSALGQGQRLLPTVEAGTASMQALDAGEDFGAHRRINESAAVIQRWAPKYARSGLQGETAQYYLNKLQALMAKEHCFLDDSLSLSGLAEKLNLSSHHLSQLLNEQLHMPFYDYINAQRIEYAKQLLREQPARAVIDIAAASGYDNKGTFYRVFKRNVGMTPAQYRSQSTVTPDGSTTRSD